MTTETLHQYDSIFYDCRSIFEKKIKDYGASWRVLRPSSLTDQIWIKAKRIKTIEEQGQQRVSDGIGDEFQGIVNYGIIALIQLKYFVSDDIEVQKPEILQWYDEQMNIVRNLFLDKNHDYGEAWRDMRISSFTDMILMKLLRLKQIEANDGKTLISEGADSHYMDCINYAIFALIKISEA